MKRQNFNRANHRLWLTGALAFALCLNACKTDDADPESDGGVSAGGETAGEMAGTQAGTEGGTGAGTDAGANGGERLTVEPIGVKIMGPDSIQAHDTFTLTASVLLNDETTLEDEFEYTWESLTPNATISEAGEVYVEGEGEVKIKATYRELSGEWTMSAGCSYPDPTGERFNTALELNTVIPPLEWPNSYSAKNSSMTDVSLKDIYSKPNFKWVKTINLLTTAGWCPACPDYLRAVADMNPELKEAGGLLIYVDVQDNDYAPADSEFANEHLSRLLGSTEGYFVGDLNSQPLSRFFGQSTAIEAFPDAYVIRRRDMTILTSQNLNRDAGMIPFVRIAEDPEQDWTTIMPPPFESVCAEGDDEASEPNDTAETAGVLMEGMSSAGICTPEPDFYQIETEGAWTVTINFSHSEADLDLYQVNPNAPDMVLQGSNGESDSETLSGEGPATLVVISYTGTSTLYTINLTTTP